MLLMDEIAKYGNDYKISKMFCSKKKPFNIHNNRHDKDFIRKSIFLLTMKMFWAE